VSIKYRALPILLIVYIHSNWKYALAKFAHITTWIITIYFEKYMSIIRPALTAHRTCNIGRWCGGAGWCISLHCCTSLYFNIYLYRLDAKIKSYSKLVHLS
jgi:hypothetical protein